MKTKSRTETVRPLIEEALESLVEAALVDRFLDGVEVRIFKDYAGTTWYASVLVDRDLFTLETAPKKPYPALNGIKYSAPRIDEGTGRWWYDFSQRNKVWSDVANGYVDRTMEEARLVLGANVTDLLTEIALARLDLKPLIARAVAAL